MQRLTLALLLLVAACSKDKAQSSSEPVASASGQAVSASDAAAAPGAAPAAASATKSWYVGTWRGEFSAEKRASTTKTKEGGPAAWEKDDGQKLSGPGSIEVVVNDEGDVTGTAKGGLGDLAIRGKVDGEQLRASIVGKSEDPTSIHNGYLVLSQEADALKGRLLAGSGDALALRQADVTLKKAAP